MPFQRRQKCIFRWCGRAWLTIWDRVKISRYSHKLMYRKRVTCELHDSYFLSMMIKTCHSKDGGSRISFGHLWEEIEWVLNYYITQCTGNSTRVWGSESWRNGAVEKTAPSRELGPRVPGWAASENRKETLMAIRVGVNMLQFCSVSNSLPHTTLSNKVRGIFF